MKIKLIAAFIIIAISVFNSSCEKECSGCPAAIGGNLPTKYIIIYNDSFAPANISAVNGTSFTFVNNTGSVKGVYSSDSIVINKPNIADRSSFIFKKDTVGTIVYRLAGKPAVSGTITLTP